MWCRLDIMLLCIQAMGTILFYGILVNNKLLLVNLNTIGSQQAQVTEGTNEAVATFLDFVTTYPDNSILYPASDILLATHSDAGFHNETKGHSRAGA